MNKDTRFTQVVIREKLQGYSYTEKIKIIGMVLVHLENDELKPE